MTLRLMDRSSLSCFQDLIQANFAGRDQLYAAASSLDDEACKVVCRRLAGHLAGHAAELQQFVLANEGVPVEPDETHLTAEILFQKAKQNQGDMGVIAVAEDCECDVKQRYDRVIETTSDFEVEGLLRRQRTEVEFGEHVLHCMARPIRPR